jgi:hypothetical protein
MPRRAMPVRLLLALPAAMQLTVRADDLGRVGYWLPPSAGNHPKADVLTFVGLGTPSAAGTSATLQVSVPRVAIYRFGPDAGS